MTSNTLRHRISRTAIRFWILLIGGLLLSAPVSHAVGDRVTDGVIVYYPFTDGGGTTVADRSGNGAPMDLEISGAVTWLPDENGVLMRGGWAATTGPATKVIGALQATHQSTFEIWAVPADVTQRGPARMISLSDDPDFQSFMMGQLSNDIEVRLLHTGKDALAQPYLVHTNKVTAALHHFVHTYDGTTERWYLDGIERAVTVVSSGNYSNWDPADLFSVGDGVNTDRPWVGTVRMVAVYDRALTSEEVLQNHAASPDAPTGPRVEAGPDQATPVTPAAPTHAVTLDGSATDDGLPDPPALVTTTWTKASGPGTVLFGDPTSLQTTADFSADGIYVLELFADDGESVSSDTLTIAVNQHSSLLSATNLAPADLAITVSTTPTLEVVCPAESAVEGHFIVAEDAAFSTIVYDSGPSSNYVCSHVAFAGLGGATDYFWSSRLEDESGLWTTWSPPTRFTTIDAGVLSTSSFRQGVDGYDGASDALLRGSGSNPLTAVREWNQGAYPQIRTGRRPEGSWSDEIYRSLLRFDLTGVPDPNAVVNVYLELTGYSDSPIPILFHGPSSFYEVLRPWGEGIGYTQSPPATGEVSWTYAEYPVPWSVPGAADVGIDRAGSSVVRGRLTSDNGHKTFWSSQALVDLVKNWIAQPQSNFGLLMQSDDESVKRVTSLAAKEHVDPAIRPRLVIETTAYADCLQEPDSGSCEDGNACTVSDTCLVGVCVSGPPATDGVVTHCGVGACTTTGTCTGGADSCTPGTPASDDASCDGIDDDCDGNTDEDYPPEPTSCGVGACQASGSMVCTAGLLEDDCTPGTPAADDATCDGIDDDCDGLIDEDYVSVPTGCGMGACVATGSTSCVSGVVEDSCAPGTPGLDDATCDGVDDDCDGLFDEDFLAAPTSCGVGACEAAGSTSCVAGIVEDSCAPGAPGLDDATCDGVDDDCDGLFDEDYLAVPTSCGVGACEAAGSTSCVAGIVEDDCAPGTPGLDDATCDGVDDDCDGLFDEDYFSAPTSCGIGACEAAGSTSCIAGIVEDSCAPGAPALDDLTCDGVDDDCDGLFDEDYLAVPTSCGIGACEAAGSTSCVAGIVEDDCAPGTPGLDDATCDGVDDDCDGLFDEDYLAAPTSCGIGACEAAGSTSCIAGIVEDDCAPGAPGIDDATCDGVDDDCDGLFDEDYLTVPTSCGVGACEAAGSTSCVAGIVEDDCAPGTPGLDDATCDGVDDDCDGLFDEDYFSAPTSCGIGACEAAGSTSCIAGIVEDSCAPGAPALDDLTCDGVDDDCDGLFDEDYLTVPTSCGVGACEAAGSTSCVAGIVEDDCAPGTPGLDDATCDGVDDDCDGLFDEDYLTVPTSCGVGACEAAGSTSCVAGIVEDDCASGTPGLDDATCDGVDDDCDGFFDEDYLAVPTSCGIGACEAAGSTSCIAGIVEDDCAPGTPGLDDATCDGVDDDCDGLFDEDYLAVPTSCGIGACEAAGSTSCIAGIVEDSCAPGAPALDDLTCDGVDDDCDGLFDEDYLSAPTSCGVGACEAAGSTSCIAGIVEDDCAPGTPGLDDATCDGVDDDCDGLFDEDYLAVPTSCGIGACEAAGSTSCIAGIVEDSCAPGAPALDDLTCDGVDDDCDGLFDEDYLSAPTSCGVGACEAAGSTSCVAGIVEDDCAPGTPGLDDATCDGVDDDCDGLFDEDYLAVPTSCGIGACEAAGTLSCIGGTTEDTCTPGPPSGDDATCDGIDDDCDSRIDEDYIPVTVSCGTGTCEASGITFCVGGTVENDCIPGPPDTEYCDGFDNDCDGIKDEADAVDAATWFKDGDGDSHGDPGTALDACEQPAGFVTTQTDCDDSNANTYPGAFEFNDGADNQCNGDPGYGLADEIAGVAGFHDPANDANYSWLAQPGATLYEVVRSGTPHFLDGCTTFTNNNSLIYDTETPAPGEVFFYVVRSLSPFAGSWGGNSAGVERKDLCPPSPDMLEDGNLESWGSSTDLAAWLESTSGGTVREELDPSGIYAGFRAARLTRNDIGALNIVNPNIPLTPGQIYSLSFEAKSNLVLPNAVEVRVRNVTRGEDLQGDGSWNPAPVYFGFDVGMAYEHHEFQFVVDPGHSAGDDFRLVIRQKGNAPIGSELWVDNVAIRAE